MAIKNGQVVSARPVIGFEQPYATPTSTRVYVECEGQSWLLDDLFSIEVNESNAKVPLWGYNQKFPSLFADGKVVVTGSVAIHFRFPNYLLFALVGIASSMESASLASFEDASRLKDLIREVRTATPAERARILATCGAEQFKIVSSLMYALRDDNKNGPDRSGAGEIDPAVWGRSGGRTSAVSMGPSAGVTFNLNLHHHVAGIVNSVERIENVHFVGCGKRYSADAQDSGQTIIEMYPFVAASRYLYQPNVTRQLADEASTAPALSTAPGSQEDPLSGG